MTQKKYGRTGGEYHGGYYRTTLEPGGWHLWLSAQDYALGKKRDYVVHCSGGVVAVRALLIRLQGVTESI